MMITAAPTAAMPWLDGQPGCTHSEAWPTTPEMWMLMNSRPVPDADPLRGLPHPQLVQLELRLVDPELAGRDHRVHETVHRLALRGGDLRLRPRQVFLHVGDCFFLFLLVCERGYADGASRTAGRSGGRSGAATRP